MERGLPNPNMKVETSYIYITDLLQDKVQFILPLKFKNKWT